MTIWVECLKSPLLASTETTEDLRRVGVPQLTPINPSSAMSANYALGKRTEWSGTSGHLVRSVGLTF